MQAGRLAYVGLRAFGLADKEIVAQDLFRIWDCGRIVGFFAGLDIPETLSFSLQTAYVLLTGLWPQAYIKECGSRRQGGHSEEMRPWKIFMGKLSR